MYFPKSKVQSNLYTNGSEFKKISTQENYIGFYFKTSRGQFFTGKTPGDGLNEQLVVFNPNFNNQTFPPNQSTQYNVPDLTQQQKNSFINVASTLPENTSFSFITTVSPLNGPDYAFSENLRPSGPGSFNQTISSVDKSYTKTLPTRKIPSFIQPIIKESDKQLGIVQRYFCKKTNEAIFIEISLSDYTLLLSKSNTIAWDLYIPVSMLWYIKGNREETFNTNKNLASIIEKNNKWFGFVNYFKEDFNQFYLES